MLKFVFRYVKLIFHEVEPLPSIAASILLPVNGAKYFKFRHSITSEKLHYLHRNERYFHAAFGREVLSKFTSELLGFSHVNDAEFISLRMDINRPKLGRKIHSKARATQI